MSRLHLHNLIAIILKWQAQASDLNRTLNLLLRGSFEITNQLNFLFNKKIICAFYYIFQHSRMTWKTNTAFKLYSLSSRDATIRLNNSIFKQFKCFSRELLPSAPSSSGSFNMFCFTSLTLLSSPTMYVSMTTDWPPTSFHHWCRLTSPRLPERRCMIIFSLLFLKDAAASYDFNDNDPDPFPRYDSTNENK